MGHSEEGNRDVARRAHGVRSCARCSSQKEVCARDGRRTDPVRAGNEGDAHGGKSGLVGIHRGTGGSGIGWARTRQHDGERLRGATRLAGAVRSRPSRPPTAHRATNDRHIPPVSGRSSGPAERSPNRTLKTPGDLKERARKRGAALRTTIRRDDDPNNTQRRDLMTQTGHAPESCTS